jgi:hypothetical protein
MVIMWGTVEDAGTARGTAEVDEAHDQEVVKGRVVGPPQVAV